MKKILILTIITAFSASSSFAACSITGGACAIEDLKNNQKQEIIKNKDKNIKKSIFSNPKSNQPSTKKDKKIIRLNK